MNALINPEHERIRAQAILRSFTDYDEAVELFAPARARREQDCDQVEVAGRATHGSRNEGQFVMRVLKAFKPNRHTAAGESAQQSALRQVTTSGCS